MSTRNKQDYGLDRKGRGNVVLVLMQSRKRTNLLVAT